MYVCIYRWLDVNNMEITHDMFVLELWFLEVRDVLGHESTSSMYDCIWVRGRVAISFASRLGKQCSNLNSLMNRYLVRIWRRCPVCCQPREAIRSRGTVTQDFSVKLATENRSEAVYSSADRKPHVIEVEGFSVLASLKIVDHVRSCTLPPKTVTNLPLAELQHKPQGVEHYCVWTVIFNSEWEETYTRPESRLVDFDGG